MPGVMTQSGHRRGGEGRAECRERSRVGTGRHGGSPEVGGGLPSLARSPCWHHCQAPPPQCALCFQQPLESVVLFAQPPGRPLRGGGGVPPMLLSAHSGPEMDLSSLQGLPRSFSPPSSLLTSGHSEDGSGRNRLFKGPGEPVICPQGLASCG